MDIDWDTRALLYSVSQFIYLSYTGTVSSNLRAGLKLDIEIV